MAKRKIIVLNVFIGIIIALLVMPTILCSIVLMLTLKSNAALLGLIMLQLVLVASSVILIFGAIKGRKGNLALTILTFIASLIILWSELMTFSYGIMLLLFNGFLRFEMSTKLISVARILQVILLTALIVLFKVKNRLILLQEGVEVKTKASKIILTALAFVVIMGITYMAIVGYGSLFFVWSKIILALSIPIAILGAIIITLSLCGPASSGKKFALKILIGVGIYIEVLFIIVYLVKMFR